VSCYARLTLASYKTDDSTQSKKLDEMNLDDILTSAEAHDTDATAEPGGTSLGGEGFLAQFAAIQDVKNDLSWDDIIPVDERVKLDEEESKVLQDEELAAATGRKRAAARLPGAYEGMEDDGDAASSKPGSPTEKKGKVVAPRKSNSQRSMELKGELNGWAGLTLDRDLRVLIRGIQKWGDIRVRYDEIVSRKWEQTDARSGKPNSKERTESSSSRRPTMSSPKRKLV
jgi:chromodomain-helicase-DNA-binding protein 1